MEYVLTEEGKRKVAVFIKECEAKRKDIMRTYWHTNNLWYREEVGRYVPFPSVNLERQRVCRRNERKMGENTGVLKRVPLFLRTFPNGS